MAVEMNSAQAADFIRRVAEQSYGSKASEGPKGGYGAVGMIAGKPIKFNTHWQARLGRATPDMIRSSNELRESLGAAAKALCGGEAQNEQFAKILGKLGLDANGSAVANTRLLSRKVAAQVVQAIAHMRGGNILDGIKPQSTKDIDTKFATVQQQPILDKLLARKKDNQPKGLDFTFKKMLSLDTHNQDPRDMMRVNGRKGGIFGSKMTREHQSKVNLLAKHYCEQTLLAEMAKMEQMKPKVPSQFEKDVDRSCILLPNGDLLSCEHGKFQEQRLEVARHLLGRPGLQDFGELSVKDRRKVHLACSLLNQELSKCGMDCFCAAFDAKGRFNEFSLSIADNPLKMTAGDLFDFRMESNGDIVVTQCSHKPAVHEVSMTSADRTEEHAISCDENSTVTQKVEVRIPAAEVDRLTELDWTIDTLDPKDFGAYSSSVESDGLIHSTSEDWTKERKISDYHPRGIQVTVAIEANFGGQETLNGAPV